MPPSPIKQSAGLRAIPQRLPVTPERRSVQGPLRVLESTRTWAQLPLFVRQPVGR